MYYKFIDESRVERFEGGAIYYNHLVFANPTDEQLAMAGFKEMVETAAPIEFDPETEQLKPIYSDGEKITKSWMIETLEGGDE